MKLIIFTVLCALAYLPLQAQHQITILVKRIRGEKGTVIAALFADEESFLKDAVYGKVVSVKGNTVHVVLDDVKPGEYGISVLHDENNNAKLDKNRFGIPAEGFAFGNNAMGVFGPPSFERTKVLINHRKVHHELRLKYF